LSKILQSYVKNIDTLSKNSFSYIISNQLFIYFGIVIAIKRSENKKASNDMKRTFLVIVMLIFLTQMYGQNETTSVFSLNDCMLYALEHSTKVNAQNFTNSNYRQDRLSALTSLFPSLSASSSINTGYGRSIDPETNTYTNTANFSNGYSASSSMTIFSGLSQINSYRASRIAYIMGGEQLQQIKMRCHSK